MPLESAPLCYLAKVQGSFSSSATACEEMGQLSCYHTLGAGSPAPPPPEPALPYYPNEVTGPVLPNSAVTMGRAHLSTLITPGPVLLTVVGDEGPRGRGITPTPTPSHTSPVVGPGLLHSVLGANLPVPP